MSEMKGRRWRVPCGSCGGEGVIDGDCTCMDDTCCCLEPEPPTCRQCNGEGSYIVSQLTDDNYEDAVEITDLGRSALARTADRRE